MSTLENIEKNKVKLTIEIGAEAFERGLAAAYQKNKGKFSLQGFRKGKAPRKMLEMYYGPEIFFDDALDEIAPDAYKAAVDEHSLEPVSRPVMGLESVSKEEGAVISIEVFVKPEVILGQYRGLSYTKADDSVSEADVAGELQRQREQNARVIVSEGKPAQNGDIVKIDFDGYIDGEPFDGGKAENYALTLGSHSFIDNFEDQIVGKELNEAFNVYVTFPEDYNAEELRGKSATFKVVLREIKTRELPELDDEFAGNVSEFETLAEYKEDIRARISEAKIAESKRQAEEQLVKALTETSGIDVPEAMITTQIDRMVDDFSRRVAQNRMSLEQYLGFMNMDENDLRDSYKEAAERNVRARLILEKIAETEGLLVTDEDLDAEIGRMASNWGVEPETVKNLVAKNESDRKSLELDVKVMKALDLVKDAAVIAE